MIQSCCNSHEAEITEDFMDGGSFVLDGNARVFRLCGIEVQIYSQNRTLIFSEHY